MRAFITAGTAEQQVPDKSIFREQFVEALEGKADYNEDDTFAAGTVGIAAGPGDKAKIFQYPIYPTPTVTRRADPGTLCRLP